MLSYEAAFGLEVAPFRIGPVPEGAFPGNGFVAARAQVVEAVRNGAGAVSLIGEGGTGKTSLLRGVIRDVDEDFCAGLVWHPSLLKVDFLATVADAFDATPDREGAGGFASAIKRVAEQQKSSGRPLVLMVDEAQSLSTTEIDRLFGLPQDGLVQSVVLAGQTSLQSLLGRCGTPLDGPVVHLEPMTPGETVDYIRHRLLGAGGDEDLISEDAAAAIHRATGGIPREINLLCERSLLFAANNALSGVDAGIIERVRAASDFSDLLMSAAPTAPGTTPEESPATFKPFLRVVGTSAPTEDDRESEPQSRPDPVAMDAIDPSGEGAGNPVEGVPRPMAGPVDDECEDSLPFEGPAQRTGLRRWPVAAAFLIGAAAAGLATFGIVNRVPNPVSPVDVSRGAVTTALRPDPVASMTHMESAQPSGDVPGPLAERIGDVLGDQSSDPESQFRMAVSLATEQPLLAAAIYSRAALRGHDRAAYYLGQMFEAGDGVPRDTALAGAWYRRASEDLAAAARSLEELAAPDRGAVSAPIPLFGRIDGKQAELFWTSGDGPDPHEYRVQFAAADGPGPVSSHTTTVSAARTPLPPDVARWRVLAQDSTGTRVAASGWQPLLSAD